MSHFSVNHMRYTTPSYSDTCTDLLTTGDTACVCVCSAVCMCLCVCGVHVYVYVCMRCVCVCVPLPELQTCRILASSQLSAPQHTATHCNTHSKTLHTRRFHRARHCCTCTSHTHKRMHSAYTQTHAHRTHKHRTHTHVHTP